MVEAEVAMFKSVQVFKIQGVLTRVAKVQTSSS
jgi:hypothetical protein